MSYRGLTKAGLANDDPIVHAAAKYSFVDVVSTLLRAGAEVHATNGNGQTPIHRFSTAFNNGFPMFPGGVDMRLEVLGLIVEAGADANAEDVKHNTPLHLLANNVRPGRRDSVVKAAELLHAHGADISQRTADGKTLADLVGRSDPELARQLQQLNDGPPTLRTI